MRLQPPVATLLLTIALLVSHGCEFDAYPVPGPPCSARGVLDIMINATRSMFAHVSSGHVVSNSVALLLVGSLVESQHGAVRVLTLFVASGTVGVLAWHSTRTSWSLYKGASSGVYGVMSALGAHLALNWSEIALRWFWLLGGLVALVVDVTVSYRERESNVAYEGHLGGAVMGLLLGLAVLRNVCVRPFERLVVTVAAFSALVLAVATLSEALCYSWRPNPVRQPVSPPLLNSTR